jgi:ATP-binding cassette subfamily B (MDR/TAP) protein 1
MATNLPASSVVSNEEIKVGQEGQIHQLTEAEQEILTSQLSLPPVTASYLMLYRYATKIDLLIITISSLFAIVAGAVFPLMTVSPLTRTL